jgi:hypothetical protein
LMLSPSNNHLPFQTCLFSFWRLFWNFPGSLCQKTQSYVSGVETDVTWGGSLWNDLTRY